VRSAAGRAAPGQLTRFFCHNQSMPPPQLTIPQMAYFPSAQYAEAWAHGLLDATNYRDHADYRREIEQTLRALAAQYPVFRIMPLDVAGLLAHAEQHNLDPASRATRLAYTTSLHAAGRDSIPWPPQRNALCWCGTNRTYNTCCGSPAFLAVEPSDPASLVLTITLDGVDPPVWRRVAIPSNTPLDQVHLMFQQAMGWHDTHTYAFDTGEYTIINPRSSTGISADGERLVSIAAERGATFIYTYGIGRGWSHTVTLDEIRPGGPDNTFTILDGAGASPPEDSSGPSGYPAPAGRARRSGRSRPRPRS
jgi:hypothetical protein